MTVVIDDVTYYRTVEVCHMAGISRNTLFRWLKKDNFDDLKRRGAFVVKVHGGPFQRKGLPDVYFQLNGQACWLELKRDDKNEPTRLQRHNLGLLAAQGAHTAAVCSWAEYLAFIASVEHSDAAKRLRDDCYAGWVPKHCLHVGR